MIEKLLFAFSSLFLPAYQVATLLEDFPLFYKLHTAPELADPSGETCTPRTLITFD